MGGKHCVQSISRGIYKACCRSSSDRHHGSIYFSNVSSCEFEMSLSGQHVHGFLRIWYCSSFVRSMAELWPCRRRSDVFVNVPVLFPRRSLSSRLTWACPSSILIVYDRWTVQIWLLSTSIVSSSMGSFPTPFPFLIALCYYFCLRAHCQPQVREGDATFRFTVLEENLVTVISFRWGKRSAQSFAQFEQVVRFGLLNRSFPESDVGEDPCPIPNLHGF